MKSLLREVLLNRSPGPKERMLPLMPSFEGRFYQSVGTKTKERFVCLIMMFIYFYVCYGYVCVLVCFVMCLLCLQCMLEDL
jgi:hypothetical protein